MRWMVTGLPAEPHAHCGRDGAGNLLAAGRDLHRRRILPVLPFARSRLEELVVEGVQRLLRILGAVVANRAPGALGGGAGKEAMPMSGSKGLMSTVRRGEETGEGERTSKVRMNSSSVMPKGRLLTLMYTNSFSMSTVSVTPPALMRERTRP